MRGTLRTLKRDGRPLAWRAAAPLAGAQEDRHSRRAVSTCTFQGSTRRVGAVAVATSHRVHDRTPGRPGAAQRSRRADGIVALSIRPSIQAVDGRLSPPVADEPAG